MDSFGSRLRDFRKAKGLTAVQMSEILGISKQTVSNVENGQTGVSQDVMATLARNGADVNFLLTGQALFIGTNGKPENPDGFVQVPLVAQKVSAGAGQEMMSEIGDKFGLEMTVPAPLKWGKGLNAVEVRGDSMTGVNIFDGDIVYFKPGEVRGDGIYIIQVNGEVLVKRLEFNHFENKVRISSENPKYPDRIESSDSQAMTILGKVRGWLHEHPY